MAIKSPSLSENTWNFALHFDKFHTEYTESSVYTNSLNLFKNSPWLCEQMKSPTHTNLGTQTKTHIHTKKEDNIKRQSIKYTWDIM